MNTHLPTPEAPTIANIRLLRRVGSSIFPVAFAFIYALFLASLPLDEFKDRDNYLDYTRYSELILASYALSGVGSVLTNEPLWLLSNIGLAQVFNSEYVLRTLIFVPAFLVSLLVLRRNPAQVGWLVLFLLIPQVIKNHIIHLRQGFGISVFLLGYFSRRVWIRQPLMLASVFVHSSFFLVNAIGIVSWMSGRVRLSPGLRIAVLLAAFVAIGLFISALAAGLGARQSVQYAEAGLAVSGLGFIIWGTIFLIFISAGVSFLESNTFPLAILVFYLTAYFLSPVAGRIFESGLLLVLLAGLSLYGWRRQAFLAVIVAYTILSYAMRVGQPGWGWGV